jgi:hypothetical protein
MFPLRLANGAGFDEILHSPQNDLSIVAPPVVHLESTKENRAASLRYSRTLAHACHRPARPRNGSAID